MRLPPPTLQRERELMAQGFSRIAGVDEAGRGPLAGPVVAAAVVLPLDFTSPHFAYLHDSKQLTAELREHLFEELTPVVEFGIGVVDAATIDAINIRQASWCAMQLAVADLGRRFIEAGANHAFPLSAGPPDFVLIDGLPYGARPWQYEAIVKGDARSLSIAAASVIAKVTRDRMMIEYSEQFPAYNFARHKGYPSPEHLRALEAHGPCAIHRRSYGPVRAVEQRRERHSRVNQKPVAGG
jgi:ribonuclease HII